MKSKRSRVRENQDTDLRDSTTYLRPQECGYFNNDLGLQHNIFITKSYCTDRYEKFQNILYRTGRRNNALPTGNYTDNLVLLSMHKRI
jgi:hypothetical protein